MEFQYTYKQMLQLLLILLKLTYNNNESYLCITTSSKELATEAGASGKAMSSAHVMYRA